MKKIVTILLMCITFYACSKNDSGNSNQNIYTYPTVSYNLHANIGNQAYDTSHSSVFHAGPNNTSNWIYWDNNTTIGSTFACEAINAGTFYKVHLYDSAVDNYWDTRSILSFTIPSINNITNHYDTSVLINIRDTVYSGHVIVSITITAKENNKYAIPTLTVNGTFNMSGTVVNGYGSDSVSFSSDGTFTNMPY